MSREWYIRTDKRNIQDTFGDIDTTEPTFKEKWRRNYKKYILWMVEAAVVIALLIVAVPVMFPKDTADYTLTLVTQTTLSEPTQQALCDALKAHGVDQNSDGEIQITVRTLTVGAAEAGQRDLPLEQLITSFKTDEYVLFAIEPSVYTRYVQAYTADGVSLFEPLGDGISSTYENLWNSEKTASLPSLLWGVRTLPEATDPQQAHLQLLKKYIQHYYQNNGTI